MVNHSTLFRHAAVLAWRNRWLWLIGLLATLGSLSSSLLLRGVLLPRLGLLLEEGEALAVPGRPFNWTTLLAVSAAGLLFILGLWLAGVLADGALIHAVNRLEAQQPASLPSALSASAKLLGRFVAVDTLIFLPPALLLAAAGLVGTGGLLALAYVVSQPGASQTSVVAILGLSGGLTGLLLCAIVPVGVFVYVLRLLAFRAVVLEGLPARASVARAWGLLRSQLGPIVVLFLLLWGVRYIIGLPASVATSTTTVIGLLAGIEPAADGILAGLANGGVLVPLTLLVLGVMGLVNAAVYAFVSAAWTVGYLAWIRGGTALAEHEEPEAAA